MKHDLPSPGTVTDSCRILGTEPTADLHDRLSRYLDLLADCSKRFNLVGPAEHSRLWSRHVLESVAFAAFLRKERPVVDIGSGAGFPGFVLALLGFEVTMVEPREKRCAFLETAIRESGSDAKLLCRRIQDTGPFPGSTQFTARAVSTPIEMVRMARMVCPDEFDLCIRVHHRQMEGLEGFILHSLPSPPLDREGFILQYSHPGPGKPIERRTE